MDVIKTIYILIALTLFSCTKDRSIIVLGEGVEHYKIGSKLKKRDNNLSDIDFVLCREGDSVICSIDILTDKYKTSYDITVGSHYLDVLKKYGTSKEQPILRKGNNQNHVAKQKNTIPNSLLYENIIFFLNQKDSSVSRIRIFKSS